MNTFLISFLILSFSYPLFALNPKCNPQDQRTINKIQAAFGIKPTPNCCDWVAVTCDPYDLPPNRVTHLLIFNSNISGQIPAAIGDLSSLQVLELYNVPNVIGNIPPTITKLFKLAELTISHASLSGPIPTFLVNLKNLRSIDLSFNALTGSIPPQLSQFPNFLILKLDGNKLTGTIPESFGHFPKSFQYLSLSRNFLTGTIPISLGNLNLGGIDLSENHFIGDASFLFGKNKILQIVKLDRNNLTFDLSKVVFPTYLKELNLSHNNIFGSLPKQLNQLIFKKLDVSYNRLCGQIPQGGSLRFFGANSYLHNKCLCGAPLPPCK